MKLIIDIPKDYYEIIKHDVEHHLTDYRPFEIIGNGISLDTVKAEIVDKAIKDASGEGFIFLGRLLRIFDNIGKADTKSKSCSTCKNNDDEFSGECYECLKGIFDHYEAESEVKPNE